MGLLVKTTCSGCGHLFEGSLNKDVFYGVCPECFLDHRLKSSFSFVKGEQVQITKDAFGLLKGHIVTVETSPFYKNILNNLILCFSYKSVDFLGVPIILDVPCLFFKGVKKNDIS